MSDLNRPVVINTPEGIAFFQLVQLKARLKLEIFGLSGHGRTAYLVAKQRYGLKGSREKVLAQLEAMLEEAIKAKQNG